MKKSKEFQFENETEWNDLGGGLIRQVYGYDERIILSKVKFQKGSVGPLHSHHHSQVTYIASGIFEVTIGGVKKIIRKGDGYFVAPNVVHGCRCVESGMVIDVFSPMREDFLS